MCEEWLNDFKSFYDWALKNGYKKNLTIERIDVNGNYEPNNCKWIPKKQQDRNKRNNIIVAWNGETHCLQEWCEILNISRDCLYHRLIRGKWNIDKAMTTPQRKQNKNISKFAKIYSVTRQSIHAKLKRGTLTLDFIDKIINQAT